MGGRFHPPLPPFYIHKRKWSVAWQCVRGGLGGGEGRTQRCFAGGLDKTEIFRFLMKYFADFHVAAASQACSVGQCVPGCFVLGLRRNLLSIVNSPHSAQFHTGLLRVVCRVTDPVEVYPDTTLEKNRIWPSRKTGSDRIRPRKKKPGSDLIKFTLNVFFI